MNKMGKKFCEKTGAWLSEYVIEWLDHGKRATSEEWDFIALIDGVEGSGKSGLAMTCAYYLDRSFNHDRIVFTPEQAIEAIDKAQPGQAIVWDEFVLGGLSDDAMKSTQTTLVKKFTTIRKKRLYIFLVIPYIFMLRKYFVMGRARFLMHTYTPDGIKRGNVKIYNYERKNNLYMRGKKFHEYNIRPNYVTSFGKAKNWPFLDWEAYEAKKDEAIETIQIEGKPENKYRESLKQLYCFIRSRHDYTNKVLSDVTGVSERTLTTFTQEAKGSINNNADLTSLEFVDRVD